MYCCGPVACVYKSRMIPAGFFCFFVYLFFFAAEHNYAEAWTRPCLTVLETLASGLFGFLCFQHRLWGVTCKCLPRDFCCVGRCCHAQNVCLVLRCLGMQVTAVTKWFDSSTRVINGPDHFIRDILLVQSTSWWWGTTQSIWSCSPPAGF